MPCLDFAFQPFDDIWIRSSQVFFFVGIIFQLIQPDGHRIPGVHVFVSGGVLSVIANQELPIVFYAPEILERVVGVSRRHIVDRIRNAEYRPSLATGIGVEQINSL